MKEFGSDFNLVDSFYLNSRCSINHLKDITLLADGRQCIVALINQNEWKRMWVPDYFCYEVLETIKAQTHIGLMFYEDNPLNEGAVESLPFEKGDVLLRVNLFGMRGFRTNTGIPCPVIEDHTHDLLGEWALNSDSDWCIASIRKTLPLPEGGVIWSPKGYKLNVSVGTSERNEYIASIRWRGMELKSRYLNGEQVQKDKFRNCFTDTEGWFDEAEPLLIDKRSFETVTRFDIESWQKAKNRNWLLLKSLVKRRNLVVLEPEHDKCSMFSFILICSSKEFRNLLKEQLIEASVYPAILWKVPLNEATKSFDFSERMISIHCDGRYTEEDIRQLSIILNNAINNCEALS